MEKVSTFTDRINEIMREKGFSQADLVRATGIERSRISYYCSGRNNPKPEPLEILAKALDVDTTWLMGYDVPKKTEKEIDLYYDKFNLLNDEGKKKVNIYMDDLLENPKYRKSDQSDPEHQLPKAKIA